MEKQALFPVSEKSRMKPCESQNAPFPIYDQERRWRQGEGSRNFQFTFFVHPFCFYSNKINLVYTFIRLFTIRQQHFNLIEPNRLNAGENVIGF